MSDSKSLVRALQEDNERVAERQAKLDSELPPGVIENEKGSVQFAATGSDFSSADVAANQRHQPLTEPDKKHFSEKVYLFPESFNALRIELTENFPTFFHSVHPQFGISPAYAMVFDAPAFISMCNEATDLAVQVDTGSVDYICKKFLNAFRAMRGVSQIQ
jgi:hypothetical protein